MSTPTPCSSASRAARARRLRPNLAHTCISPGCLAFVQVPSYFYVAMPALTPAFCAPCLAMRRIFLSPPEPRASTGVGGGLRHGQEHRGGAAGPIGDAGRPPALVHDSHRASAAHLDLPLPISMCFLPQLLLPAVVAVSLRGKRTGWTEASERRKTAERFGACGGTRQARGRPRALSRALPLACPWPFLHRMLL